MSSIKLESNASGTGVFTIASPNSNTNRTLTLPDQTGTVLTGSGAIGVNASAPTNSIAIDSSGNVGIGTTTPSTAANGGLTLGTTSAGKSLIINSSSNGNNGLIRFIDSNGSNSAELVGGTSQISIYGYGSRDMLFWTNGTERARITSGGYFKASNNGSYVSSTGTYHELCQSDDTASTIIRATNSTYSYTGGATRISIARNTTNGSFNALVYYNEGAAANKFVIADSGNATNTNGSYGTISDIKIKQDITDATPQWDDIKNLRFRKYRLKNEVALDPNAKPFLGLIAQEAELVCPGLIEEQKDYEDVEVSFVDEAGNSQTKTEMRPTGTTTKSIKTSILYMKAVKALQEAQLRIETLEAQNAAFEARLAALEAK